LWKALFDPAVFGVTRTECEGLNPGLGGEEDRPAVVLDLKLVLLADGLEVVHPSR
jgi:hypothetical protein